MIEVLRIALLLLLVVPTFLITRIYWKNFNYFLSRKDKYAKSEADLLPKKLGSSIALSMLIYYILILVCGLIFKVFKNLFGL